MTVVRHSADTPYSSNINSAIGGVPSNLSIEAWHGILVSKIQELRRFVAEIQEMGKKYRRY